MSSDTADSRGMVSVDSAMERPTSLPLARESSIYSLTLDEFQNHIGEPAKNFGSMNMDEFISNIWTAEESHAVSAAVAAAGLDGTVSKQLSLPRQGSLTLTGPLGRKTVEEVWSEIHKGQELLVRHGAATTNGGESAAPPHPRKPTFGEMTLEDFLIKAGVVKNDNRATAFGNGGREPELRQAIGLGYNDRAAGNGGLTGTNPIAPAGIPRYQVHMMQHQPGSGDPNESATKRMGNNGCFGAGRAAIGEQFSNGAFGTLVPAAGRPHSSDGMCINQMDPPVQYGMDMEMRCRKRPLHEPVEKVVERRQRRIIKNRESAARSRARKQAYTVELEAELNQLKEENTRLRKLQEEEKQKRKRKLLESLSSNGGAATTTQKKMLRRTFTGPW